MKYNQDDLFDLLDELNPKLDHSGKNLIVDCPWCKHREASVSLEKDGNLFGCFRKKQCGEVANIYKLLNFIGKFNQSKNIEKFTTKQSLKCSFNQLNTTTEILDLTVENCLPPFGWSQTFDHEYLNQRGFTKQHYHNYQVGTSVLDPKVKNDYIIFLVYRDHEIKGWVARHIWSKSKIDLYNKEYEKKFGISNYIKRYRNAEHVNFAKLLYGYDEITEKTDTIILVEGIFDKIAIDNKLNLFEQDEIKCLATFKGDVSEFQVELLKNKNIAHIILFYDPDIIGKIKTNALRLKETFEIKIALSLTGSDPDEMNNDEFFQVLDNLYDPSYFNYNFMKKSKLKF